MTAPGPTDFHEIRLPGGVTVRVFPAPKFVETTFPDGKVVGATRADTDENRRQAKEQGYDADADGCWWSVVEHEMAHSIIAHDVLGVWSPALRDVAGDPHPLYLRYWEESLALAFQKYINTRDITPPLIPYVHRLATWRARLAEAVGGLESPPEPEGTP